MGRADSLEHMAYPRAHPGEDDVEQKLSQDMFMKIFLTWD